ncbi:hypothetical protein B0A52_04717 [Exophiala mesophila]|uniref:Uncharacterized protein n=1 Tax=Exophiala mesophila TaxID=212818 RepID=A0A438N941_EXOME|nr:hypothetical protein B0A52_04717 [Exophiala mesophila]
MAQENLGAFQNFPDNGLHKALSEIRGQTEHGERPENTQASQQAHRPHVARLSKAQRRNLRRKRVVKETRPMSIPVPTSQEQPEETPLPSGWTRTRVEGAKELPLNRRKRKLAIRRSLMRDRAQAPASASRETGELSREDVDHEVQERSMRARIQPSGFARQVESQGMTTALADFGKNEGARLQSAFQAANEQRWKSLGSGVTDEDKMDSITKGLEDSL